jgi:hypothetical protein
MLGKAVGILAMDILETVSTRGSNITRAPETVMSLTRNILAVEPAEPELDLSLVVHIVDQFVSLQPDTLTDKSLHGLINLQYEFIS